MGITKGVDIYVRKVAPLGDPVEITVRGYELSIRKADASMIEVLCQLDIAQSLGYISMEELEKTEDIADHLSRIMSGLRKNLFSKIPQQN